jgi:hypothetical protein
VLGALAIGALHDRVVQRGLDDRRLEVIDDDALRDTAEPVERVAMTAEPRPHFLVEDEFDVTVATERERHHERPRLAPRPAARVVHQAGIAEVHLGFGAGIGFDPDDRVRRPRLEATDESIDRPYPPPKPWSRRIWWMARHSTPRARSATI